MKLSFLFLILFVAGCASKQSLDRSLVNSPMMDFDKQVSIKSTPPHTGLKSFSQSSGGAGCSVCAH